MMTHLQHICLYDPIAVYKICLRFFFRVSHKQEAVCSMGQAYDDRTVIGITVMLFRPQNRKFRAAKSITVSCLRQRILITFDIHGVYHVPIGCRIIINVRHDNRVAIKFI